MRNPTPMHILEVCNQVTSTITPTTLPTPTTSEPQKIAYVYLHADTANAGEIIIGDSNLSATRKMTELSPGEEWKGFIVYSEIYQATVSGTEKLDVTYLGVNYS